MVDGELIRPRTTQRFVAAAQPTGGIDYSSLARKMEGPRVQGASQSRTSSMTGMTRVVFR
jgi:hypothetical protein